MVSSAGADGADGADDADETDGTLVGAALGVEVDDGAGAVDAAAVAPAEPVAGVRVAKSVRPQPRVVAATTAISSAGAHRRAGDPRTFIYLTISALTPRFALSLHMATGSFTAPPYAGPMKLALGGRHFQEDIS
jgi:hypothetical protein